MTTAVAAPAFRSPGASSLVKLQTDVLDFISGTPDDLELNSLARKSINLAIDDVNGELWHDIVGYQNITLVAGTGEHALNADVGRPRRFDLQDSSYYPQSLLKWLSFDEFSLRYSKLADGSPTTYTIGYETHVLYFDRVPTTTYVGTYPYARLWYYRTLPHMQHPSDALVAPAIYAAYITHHATARIAAIRAPQKYPAAALAVAESKRQLYRMNSESQTDWSHE